MNVRETFIKENSYFVMYEIVTKIKGRNVTKLRIYRKTTTHLVEEKTMVGGGHASMSNALAQFDGLTCVAIYNAHREKFPA